MSAGLAKVPGFWRGRGRVLLVVGAGLAVTLAAVWAAHHRRRQFYDDQVERTAREIGRDLEMQARTAGAYVEALAAYFENSATVTETEFNAFMQRTAARWPGLFAVSWQACVDDAERATFEAAMRLAGHDDFEILDASTAAALSRAARREIYFPITFRFVPHGSGPPVGLDRGPDARAMRPKWNALLAGTPCASALTVLRHADADTDETIIGFVVNAAVETRNESPSRLRGFASATFLIAPMVRAAIGPRDVAGLRIEIEDVAADADAPHFQFPDPAPGSVGKACLTTIDLPGSAWTLRVAPTPEFYRGGMAGLPLGVALSGVLLTLAAAGLTARQARERRQRRLSDAARRAAERKFHEVVENMAGAVTVFGTAGSGETFVVWDMNAAAMALVAPGCEEIIGRPLADVFGMQMHEALQGAIRRVWASGRPEKLPPVAHERAGGMRWLGCNVFRLESGEVVTVCNDLTAQKEVEQELRQARTELEVALEACGVGIWSWDRALARAHIDPRTAVILDVGATTVLQPGDLAERIPAADGERLRAEAAAALAGMREFESEVQFSARDGSRRRLCLRARPVRGADGTVRHIVGCVWDATQRRRQEEDREQRKRSDSVTTLAGGIAHELNNALAPLTIGLDLLRMRYGDDAEAAETLHTMIASTRKATAVVKQLRGFSRGGAEVAIPAQPHRILDALREQLPETFPPGITVQVDLPETELPAVDVAARPLHQALQSLCVNAREAMRATGTLSIRARPVTIAPRAGETTTELVPGDYVAFEVIDTGPGIPEAIRDRIFEPFFTTKESGRGTGLGLSTALGIVRAAQGAIRVESEKGRGACFTVLVPVSRAGRSTHEATVNRVASRAPGQTLRGRTVLLADDDTMVRDVARSVLETAGMRVCLACDGREAVKIFSRQPESFDLVVLDLMMPEVDGATAGAAIHGLRPGVPLVGASGFTSEQVLSRARTAGFTSFLAKPYTMDGLLDALRSALTRPERDGAET